MKESSSESSGSETSPKSNRSLTEYEKKRMERIKENKARMEALKLPTLASSLLTPSSKNNKNKKKIGKKNIWKKKDDDEDYQPSDDDEENTISCSEQGEKSEDDDLPADKGKVKQSLKKFNQKKKPRKLDFMDDDQTLQQAIALSLEESLDNSYAVLHERDQKRKKETSDMRIDDNKGRAAVKVETDKRKKTRRLNTSSRMQITEDQVIIHFFQFDEAGKGGISVKDLKRVAVDHDFGWSDDEMADMIHFFDSDGNGKLNLEDFRKILHRCNMIKE